MNIFCVMKAKAHQFGSRDSIVNVFDDLQHDQKAAPTLDELLYK